MVRAEHFLGTVPITHDDSRWPVVIVRMPAETASDADFAEHLRQLSGYFMRRIPFGLVVDARGAPPLTPLRRRQVADFLDEQVVMRGRRLIGTAVILTSPVARGVFRVIEWSSKNDRPMMCFPDIEPGIDWLRSLTGLRA